MFQFLINNLQIEQPPDSAISLTVINPAFDQGSIARGYTFNTSAYITPHNTHIFGHIDRYDITNRKKKYPARLVIGGVLHLTGFIHIEDVFDEHFNFYFQTEPIDLLARISELEWENILPTIQAYELEPEFVIARTEVMAPGAIYTFIINGDVYSLEITEPGWNVLFDPNNIFNQIQALVDQINDDYPGFCVVEFPINQDYEFGTFFRFINQAVPGFQLEVQDDLYIYDVVYDPAVQANEFRLFVQDVINDNDERIAFPVITNGDFYEENDLFAGIINPIFNGDPAINQPADRFALDQNENEIELPPQFHTTYIPMTKVAYLVSQICEAVGIDDQIQGFLHEKIEFFQLLIHNNTSLDYMPHFEGRGPVYQGWPEYHWNVFRQFINLQDHIPFSSPAEFWETITTLFQAYFTIEGTTLTFHSTKAQIEATGEDWTDIIEDDTRLKIEQNDGYIFRYREDETDRLGNLNNLQRVDAGKRELDLTQQISIPFITNTFVRLAADILSDRWRIPSIQQLGNTPLNSGNHPAEPKIMLYHDTRPTLNNNFYPYASWESKSMDGTEISDISLEILGEKGIYSQFWKGIPEILTGREIEISARITAHHLQKIMKWESSAVTIRHSRGQIKGYIKEIKINVNKKWISPAKIRLILPSEGSLL